MTNLILIFTLPVLIEIFQACDNRHRQVQDCNKIHDRICVCKEGYLPHPNKSDICIRNSNGTLTTLVATENYRTIPRGEHYYRYLEINFKEQITPFFK